MKPFHKQLKDRLEATGDVSSSTWHFMADVLEHAASEADKWTNRADDARRIPDMIDEAVRWCRDEAKKHEVADPVVVRLEADVAELQKQLADAQCQLVASHPEAWANITKRLTDERDTLRGLLREVALLPPGTVCPICDKSRIFYRIKAGLEGKP